MKIENLTNTVGEWLRGTGPESDIVMSSRVRLARNVAQFPFVSRATEQDRADVEKFLRDRIARSPAGAALEYIDVGGLAEVDRQFLVERQLISRDLAEAQGARAVAIDGREQVSLMVNEEDHLRIQCLHSGLDLRGVWEQIRQTVRQRRPQALLSGTFACLDATGLVLGCSLPGGHALRRRNRETSRPSGFSSTGSGMDPRHHMNKRR